MPRLIDLWDRIARRAMGVRPLTEGSVLSYAIRRYPGRSLTSGDGVTLSRGDPVIELHLDSRLLAAKTAGASTHKRVLFILRELLQTLPLLGQLVRSDPRLSAARGLWALTLFHRGAEPLGFTVVDMAPGFTRWLTTFYLKWLLSSYHPDGRDRLQQREKELVPKELFMSTETLLSRYGEERKRGRQPKGSSTE